MKYPDDFNSPAFPAGKRIAVSRMMAIGISIGALGVVFLCGAILWAAHSERIEPFLISVNNTTGTWEIVGHDHHNMLSATYTIQESVIRNFITNWFTVTADTNVNDARWKMCGRAECKSDEYRGIASPECSLACVTGGDLFETFVYNIVPIYQDMIAAGITWTVDSDTWNIKPVGAISQNGGTWQISTQIKSNTGGIVDIIAFAQIAYTANELPQTMGYYVSKFNAYRING